MCGEVSIGLIESQFLLEGKLIGVKLAGDWGGRERERRERERERERENKHTS